MNTNINYIIDRALNRQEDFDTSAARLFWASLSPEDQEVIEDIYTYNGHVYFTEYLHKPIECRYTYTDGKESIGLATIEDMELMLSIMIPVSYSPYVDKAPAAAEPASYIVSWAANIEGQYTRAFEQIDGLTAREEAQKRKDFILSGFAKYGKVFNVTISQVVEQYKSEN